MKPLGARFEMDGTLSLIRPTPVEDAVWEAVSKAIEAGWMPEQFRSESATCWDEYLRQKREDDAKAWRKK